MPKVPMVARSGFTYMTRRLQAGDSFEARNPLEARILERVRRVADYPAAREAAKAEIAPIPTVEEALTAEVVEPAPKKAKAQLDHDGDGKAGGSRKGSTRRKRTARTKK
jgi:hypothetical protein